MKNPFVLVVIILLASAFLWALGPEEDWIGPIVRNIIDASSSSWAEVNAVGKGMAIHQALVADNPYEHHAVKDEFKKEFGSLNLEPDAILEGGGGVHHLRGLNALGPSPRPPVGITINISPTGQAFAEKGWNYFSGIGQRISQVLVLQAPAATGGYWKEALLWGTHFGKELPLPSNWAKLADRFGNGRERGKYASYLDSPPIGGKKRLLLSLWNEYLKEKSDIASEISSNEGAQAFSTSDPWPRENMETEGWGLGGYPDVLSLFQDNGARVKSGPTLAEDEQWLADQGESPSLLPIAKGGDLADLLKTSFGAAAFGTSTFKGKLVVLRKSARVYAVADSRTAPLLWVRQGDTLDRDTSWEGKIYYRVWVDGKEGYIYKKNGIAPKTNYF